MTDTLKAYKKELLDLLIEDEKELYRIYADNRDICVGIKIMADAIREKYDD